MHPCSMILSNSLFLIHLGIVLSYLNSKYYDYVLVLTHLITIILTGYINTIIPFLDFETNQKLKKITQVYKFLGVNNFIRLLSQIPILLNVINYFGNYHNKYLQIYDNNVAIVQICILLYTFSTMIFSKNISLIDDKLNLLLYIEPEEENQNDQLSIQIVQITNNIDPFIDSDTQKIEICSICMDNLNNAQLKSCNHIVCSKCSSQMNQCPYCRKYIESVNVYPDIQQISSAPSENQNNQTNTCEIHRNMRRPSVTSLVSLESANTHHDAEIETLNMV